MTTKANNNTYPIPRYGSAGLHLREHFALTIMRSLLRNEDYTHEAIPRIAVEFADNLIKELNK